MLSRCPTTLILSGCGQGTVSNPPGNGNANTTPPPTPPTPTTASAVIKHVVVIFGENISFDHYFGTYPNAANLAGETPFIAATAAAVAAGTTTLPATPTNISNYISTPSLLTANPNLNSATRQHSLNSVASNPFRLAPAQAATQDQDHDYNPEQLAFDNGKMDLFPHLGRYAERPCADHCSPTALPHDQHHRAHDGLLRRQHRHRHCGTTHSTTPSTTTRSAPPSAPRLLAPSISPPARPTASSIP